MLRKHSNPLKWNTPLLLLPRRRFVKDAGTRRGEAVTGSHTAGARRRSGVLGYPN